MRIKLLIIIVFIKCSLNYGQNKRIDSLSNLISKNKNEVLLNQLAWEQLLVSDFSNAKLTCEEALKINKKTDFELAQTYNYLAIIAQSTGEFETALQNHLKSIEIKEKINNEGGLTTSLIGIGDVYFQLKNEEKTLEYYKKALSNANHVKDEKSIAAALLACGNFYYFKTNYTNALKNYEEALGLETKNNNLKNAGVIVSNIGNIHFTNANYTKALEYYKKSVEIREQINDSRGLADSYYNIALVLIYSEHFQDALPYLKLSQDLSLKIGSKESLMNSYIGFSEAYEGMHNSVKALEFYKLYSYYKDSLLNLETNQSINKLNALYETEKKEKAIQVLNKEKEKQDAISKEELKKRNLVILFISIGLLFILAFAFFIYKSYKRKALDNQEITKQNEIIKYKNQEITDSINYALRIQNSFLASESTFSNNLKDYFILFKPKDIVSGDFYWAEQIGDKFYVCVADSTGHGIPGAFMSLLNISLLNEAVLSKNLTSTSEILNFVRRILIQGLKTDPSGQGGNDGMDCSLISINLKTMQLEFTGANNPIWIVRNKEVIELDANKMPVGRSPKQDVPFVSQSFGLLPNDFIYLFTDGLPDQFGGPKGKKYKYKQLQSRVVTISDFALIEQRKIIEDSFLQWKGNLEQVDDVLMIGIKI